MVTLSLKSEKLNRPGTTKAPITGDPMVGESSGRGKNAAVS